MMWILGALTGVCLFLGGWFVGQRMKPTEAEKPSPEELEERKKRNEQWDALMSYSGRVK